MSHQILQSLVNLTFGVSAFDFYMLAVCVKLSLLDGLYQLFLCCAFKLLGFFLLVTDNILAGFRKLRSRPFA